MKSKFFRFLLPAALLTVTALAQTGSAAAAPSAPATSSIKIGTINMQAVILATNEGQRDFDALQKKFQPKQTELQSLNKEIDDLKKQLDAQGSKMNDDARATLVKSIESKQKSFQRSAEDAQNDYDGQKNEIVQKILTKLAPIIEKYAQENAYGLIVDVSNPWPQGEVLWAGPSVDISKAIVDTYNSQSASTAPAAGTAPAAHAAPSAPSATPRPKPAAPAAPKP